MKGLEAAASSHAPEGSTDLRGLVAGSARVVARAARPRARARLEAVRLTLRDEAVTQAHGENV